VLVRDPQDDRREVTPAPKYAETLPHHELQSPGLLSSRKPPHLVRAILQRLGQHGLLDVRAAREIGDGPRHAHRAMDATGAEAGAVHGVRNELLRRAREPTRVRERGGGERGVETSARALTLARGAHPRAHQGRVVAQPRVLKFGGGECGKLDLYIKSVEYRT
jgi:hypothetical protein